MNIRSIPEWLKTNWKKITAWTAGSVAALLLLVAFVLPGIVRSQAEKAVFKATGRKATIESVKINPLNLSVTVNGLRYFEADGKSPFIELSRLKASLSLASVYRMAPVVDGVLLDKPSINIVRTAPNRYNFSDIIEYLAKQPKPEKKGETRFSINNITISGGSVEFRDNAVSGGKLHTVKEINIGIPFISNIPYLAEKYTDPRLSAIVNGARFDFSGKAKPLAKSVEATVNLKLHELNLPHYLAYLPADLPIRLDKGSLTLDLGINYKVHASKKPELIISGLTRLDNIAVSEKKGASLTSFNRLDLKSKTLELFARNFEVESVSLDGLLVNVSRGSDGRLNLLRLAEKKGAPPAKAETKKAKDPKKDAAKTEPQPKFRIALVELTNGVVRFIDQQPKGGFKTSLKDISVKFSNISNEKDAKAALELTLSGDGGESIAVNGSATIEPVSADASFSLKGIKLQKGWPYLQTLITSPVKGTLAVNGKAEFSPENGLTASDIAILLTGIAAEFGEKDGVDISRLELSGIRFSQKENRAEVGEIRLSKGKVAISKEADGSVSPLSLMVKQPSASTSAPPKPAAAKSPSKDTKPLSWLVKKIGVNGLDVRLRDKSFQEPPEFNINKIRIAAGNLSGPKFSPMPLKFDAMFGDNAPLKAVGTVNPQPFRYKGDVSFSRLPIRAFEDYVPDSVNIFFLAGTIDSNMKIDLVMDSANKPTGSFEGSAGVRGFHSVDTVQEEDLLKWESLQLDEIKGQIAPFSLSMRQIALNGVYSRIAVRKDGTLNLQNLIAKEKKGAQTGDPKQQAASAPKDASAQQQSAPPPNIKIETLTIQDGTMAFSDAHLPQQFRTTFHNLGGRVSGLSSEMNQFADVDLRGNLENHSPLLIKGRINPLRNDLFVDLTISFKDIDLTPATPYAGTYLGYAIDKGKLSLDLKYLIENKALKAENKVFVDQFTFGESVKSDKATSLPVRLGVALLKDRNGEIHLDLPVSGRTDDPKFSIWGVVWQVVANLFIKAATSPFALLSSMFGSGEDLSAVSFMPGLSSLAPSEKQKLSTLAKGLVDRPALKVEITGYVHRERDAEGYRSELLNRKMRQEKLQALLKGTASAEGLTLDKVEIPPQEYSTYLKSVYKKEKFPKPRNMIGMLKDLPDSEMKKLIITNTVVGEPELRQLVGDRVATVRNYLITTGKVPQERLFQKADDIFKPSKKEKTGGSRVELNPIVQ